jgi:hypothetical protein
MKNMKKLMLMMVLFVTLSVVTVGQDPQEPKTKEYTEQSLSKEIERLKEDNKQEKIGVDEAIAEKKKHENNISFNDAQIKKYEKAIKALRNLK